MAAVVQDLVDQCSLSHEKGYKVVRVFQVSGLTGNGSTRLYNATLLPEIPAQGAAHPDIPGIYARSIVVNPTGPSAARVIVTYQARDPATTPPDDNAPPQYEVGAVTVETETNMDIEGNLIKLSYTVTKEDPDTHELVTVTNHQAGRLTVHRAQPVFKLSRRETSNPAAKSLMYTGKIYSDTFLGKPAKTWMVVRIVGRSDDGGESYNVDYEFQYNSDTWEPTVVAIDPDTGEPPIDSNGDSVLVEGTGIKKVVVYQTIAFSGLNL